MKTITEEEFRRLCDGVESEASAILQRQESVIAETAIQCELFARLCHTLEIDADSQQATGLLEDKTGYSFAIMQTVEENMLPDFLYVEILGPFLQRINTLSSTVPREEEQAMIILVAEDSEDIRLMLKLVLEHQGYCVAEAANGREAVAVATREHPNLILMDLNMPIMDGIAATRYLREQPETSQVPIIAITAHCADPSWHARAMAAGCVRCVGKPVDFELLGSLIKLFLGRQDTRAAQ